jgi:hypothetical protein
MTPKGGNEAAQARSDEQARQAQIRAGTAAVDNTFNSQFTDDYYKGRRDAYTSYAMPQLEDQHAKAARELTYALARGGNLDSSVRGYQEGQLQKLYNTNRQGVADQALGQENDARNAVEGARSDLIRTLTATGDASGAAQSAATRSVALSQPTPYSPVGDMFSSFTSALGTQSALERANAMSGGAIRPRYNTGLFGINPSAMRVS